MEKPKSFIHFERRESLTVVIIGRAAVPVAVIVWAFVSVIVGLFLWGVLAEYWAPFLWTIGILGGLMGLTFVVSFVATGVLMIMDVNKPEYRGGLTSKKD